jgi:hypothetical protein
MSHSDGRHKCETKPTKITFVIRFSQVKSLDLLKKKKFKILLDKALTI